MNHRSHCPLARRFQPIDRLGKENPFLDLRRQQRKVQQLANPRSGEPEPRGYVSTGSDSTTIDGGLDLVRERQHDGDAG